MVWKLLHRSAKIAPRVHGEFGADAIEGWFSSRVRHCEVVHRRCVPYGVLIFIARYRDAKNRTALIVKGVPKVILLELCDLYLIRGAGDVKIRRHLPRLRSRPLKITRCDIEILDTAVAASLTTTHETFFYRSACAKLGGSRIDALKFEYLGRNAFSRQDGSKDDEEPDASGKEEGTETGATGQS
jgi:hypothetical protein